jgi:hypothetical protein
MGRGLTSSFLDQEGAGVWIPSTVRYRTNACDHSTAVSKVFSQIDGGPVTATCFVQTCSYALNPGGIDTSYVSSSQSFEVRPNPVVVLDRGQRRALADDSSRIRDGQHFHRHSLHHRAQRRRGTHGAHPLRLDRRRHHFIVNKPGFHSCPFTMVDPYQSSTPHGMRVQVLANACNLTARRICRQQYSVPVDGVL